MAKGSREPEELDEGALLAEEEAVDGLRGVSIEETFRRGHAALLRRLVAKCETGTANHQELAILRNLLRDNGMTMGIDAQKTIEPKMDLLETHGPLPLLEAPNYDD